VSETQQETGVEEVVEASEGSGDRERREARERAYQDVSLRAVELLAKAQKAADEAVAEAQAYARDLEETAREQYRHILQRAHEAARGVAGASVAGEDGDGAPAGPVTVAAASGSTVDAQQLEYVRTYARVAHTQLKAVLGALNDELDRLADLADGTVEGESAEPQLPEPPAPARDASAGSGETVAGDVDDDVDLGHG
jgi:cell division septum initiation protein DivIVA